MINSIYEDTSKPFSQYFFTLLIILLLILIGEDAGHTPWAGSLRHVNQKNRRQKKEDSDGKSKQIQCR